MPILHLWPSMTRDPDGGAIDDRRYGPSSVGSPAADSDMLRGVFELARTNAWVAFHCLSATRNETMEAVKVPMVANFTLPFSQH